MRVLNDKNTYIVLKSDPTEKTEKELNKALFLWKKSKKISEVTYINCCVVAIGYLRDSMVCQTFISRGFLHDLSCHLLIHRLIIFHGILTRYYLQFLGILSTQSKNFSHFAEFVTSETLNSDQVLEPFDVVS